MVRSLRIWGNKLDRISVVLVSNFSNKLPSLFPSRLCKEGCSTRSKMHSGDVDPHASPPTSPKNQATAGGESTQFRRPQNRMLAILCCFLAVLCILVLGSVSVIEWTFRLPFDIDAPTTVAGFNYGAHATLERQIHHTKGKLASLY